MQLSSGFVRPLIALLLTAATVAAAGSPTRPGPGIGMSSGADCRSSCSRACDRISCQGLNVSQCQSARLSCRASCSSRC